MNSQIAPLSDLQQDISNELESATEENWQNILYETKLRLSLEGIEDPLISDQDKENLIRVLMQQIEKAAAEKSIDTDQVKKLSVQILSRLEAVATESDLQNFVYLLAKEYPFLQNIPLKLQKQDAVSAHDEIVRLSQGVTI